MCSRCCYSWMTASSWLMAFSSSRYQRVSNDMDKLSEDALISDTPEDLTKCGICKRLIDEPKSLPCLHTFCLTCLVEWNTSKGSTDSLPCPACNTSAPLSADGLDGLLGNAFVSSIIERSQILTPAKDTLCVCCEVSSKLLARCNQCNGFLCKKGLQIHQTIKCLRKHQVYNLEQLQSGKIDMSLACDKTPMCQKHKGQGLWFFCETCNVLICRDCTVVSHRSPDHIYIELDSAVLKQKCVIEQLIQKSNITALKIDGALRITRSTKSNFDSVVEQVLEDIEKTEELAIEQVRKVVSADKSRLQEHVTAAKGNLDVTEEELCSQQIQLKRAQDMATKLLKEGSDFDVASIYQQLTASFLKTTSINPSLLEGRLCDITFKPDDDFSSRITQLGALTLGVEKISKGHWVIEKEFGLAGAKGHLKCPSGIAVTSHGDLVVANCDPTTPVHTYNSDGIYQLSLDKRSTSATDVLVAPCNGNIYVTTEKSKYVKVYNEYTNYLRKFLTVPPSKISAQNPRDVNTTCTPNGDVIHQPDANDNTNVPQTSGYMMLRGLAFQASNQRVLVGEERTKYISVHEVNDNHVTSFRVPITPYFLGITQEDFLVVSSREEDTDVYILDTNGNQLYTIRPDQSIVESWYPSGICVSKNNEICIANFGAESKGVHCFTTSGEYLGSICDTIESPEGLISMSNDMRLAVVEWEACIVKVFSRYEVGRGHAGHTSSTEL